MKLVNVVFFVLLAAVNGQGKKNKVLFTERMRVFSGSMYKTVIEQGGNNNMIFSPLSVYHTLGMLLAGSAGDTRSELLLGMGLANEGYGLSDKNIHNLMRKLYGNTVNGKGQIIRLANGLYVQDSYPIKQNFTNILTKSYRADVQGLDFGDPQHSADTINDWIANMTEDKITDLISSDDIGALTRFVIVNAVYFKASWEDPFKPLPSGLRYTLLDGSSVQVEGMVVKSDLIKTVEIDNVDFYAIPYKGQQSFFVVGLPKVGETLERLTRRAHSVFGRMAPVTEWGGSKVLLSMPKFEIDLETDAKSVLMALNIRRIFDERSDLSGISDERLTVSDFLHKAFIRVNEEGTEAAAASVAIGAGRSNRGNQVVNVDRPFFYGIFSVRGNVFTFLGQITDPRPT